jgi:hypothetical protein
MKYSARSFVIALMLAWLGATDACSQTQMASLRPGPQVLWHRVSPSPEQPEGPVLYQLLLNASGTPGAVPVFDANPRHLTNAPITITGGNVVIGGGSGLIINGTNGLVTFNSGQVFPGITGVNSVTAGNGLITIGGTPLNPTVGLNTVNTDLRYLQLTGGTLTGAITLNGSLALPNTTSASLGTITFAGQPFLHNFGTKNTFVGAGAGNFSLTGADNTGVGFGALAANTTGGGNSAFGLGALAFNTTGPSNSAFGDFTLNGNTTGQFNSAFGYVALQVNTTGNNNSAFGAGVLNSNTTGGGNSGFGFEALVSNTTGESNSAFGLNALGLNTTGAQNSAFGVNTLGSNTTGIDNSAFGMNALRHNTTGMFNTAFGINALDFATTANSNAAFGTSALQSATTGGSDAALGFHALLLNTTGSNNTAAGTNALGALVSGTNNIGIGNNAGSGLTGSESNNIDIGSLGTAGESGVIRIGDASTQTAAFIAGINGATSASGVNVFVNSAGQLGTATSSRRFKQDISDLGDESDVLMKLRPVAFFYKPALDSTHTRQYGLVAEEVAQIAPGLVVFDKEGQPQTVRYHFVNAMLLNELQRQHRLIEAQQEQIAAIEQQMKTLMLRMAAMERSAQQSNTAEVAALPKQARGNRSQCSRAGRPSREPGNE